MSTNDGPADADPRPLLGLALDQIAGLVAAVPAERFGDPTPCADWDLRTLLGHVVAMHRRVAVMGAGGEVREVPHVLEVADDEVGDALAAERAEIDAAWKDDASLARPVSLPWGEVPGAAAAMGGVQELTVHAWDIARATGQEDRLDPRPAAAVLPVMAMLAPAEGRGGPLPFGPIVEVGADAPPIAALVAWHGRTP